MAAKLLQTAGLTIDFEDVHAMWTDEQVETRSTAHWDRPDTELMESIFGPSPGARGPAVDVHTRLRESGGQNPLLRLHLRGAAAVEILRVLVRLEHGGDASFVRCGRWFLRPSRVRALQRNPTLPSFDVKARPYVVFMGMTDAGGDGGGGWVTRIELDEEAGQQLEHHLERRGLTRRER